MNNINNRSLQDVESQFPSGQIGSNYLSYDNTKFYSLNDSYSDYANINDTTLVPPKKNNNNEQFDRVVSQAQFQNFSQVNPSIIPSMGKLSNDQYEDYSVVDHTVKNFVPQQPLPPYLQQGLQQQKPQIRPPPGFENYKAQFSNQNINPGQFQQPKVQQFQQQSSQSSMTQSSNYYECPVCKNLAVSTCSCQFKDASCPNGHKWFRSINGIKQIGTSPNHN